MNPYLFLVMALSSPVVASEPIFACVRFVPNVREFCPTGIACTYVKRNFIVMAEQEHLTGQHCAYLELENIMFPHFYSKNLLTWRDCGEAIGRQFGLTVTFNSAQVLCHEGAHLAGFKH